MRNKKLIILLSVLGGLALLIILASVVFSVHTVVARCRNDVGDGVDALSAEVVSAANISISSIFMLDDDAIISRVNEKVLYAEMVNVERVFPNKVNLNYNRLYEDIRFQSDGRYYTASTSGRILSAGQAAENDTVISVKLQNSPSSTAVGTYFSNAGSQDLVALDTLIRGVERLGDDAQAFDKGLYREIDLTGSMSTGIIMQDILVTTRSGVMFELRANSETGERGDAAKIFSQLRVAVTMYVRGKFSVTNGRYIIPYNHDNSGFYSAV